MAPVTPHSAYDAELAQVSDDSPTLAQPTVPVYKAAGFIPYSIEVGEDYPGFAAEMRRLLDAGYIDLVAAQSATGSGSGTALPAAAAVPAVVVRPDKSIAASRRSAVAVPAVSNATVFLARGGIVVVVACPREK